MVSAMSSQKGSTNAYYIFSHNIHFFRIFTVNSAHNSAHSKNNQLYGAIVSNVL